MNDLALLADLLDPPDHPHLHDPAGWVVDRYNMAKHGSTPALKDWTELQRRTARLEARGRARTAPTTGDTP